MGLRRKLGGKVESISWDTDIVGFGGGVMRGEVGKGEGFECHFEGA